MMDSVVVERASARFWPQGWWRLVEFRIGIVPLPVYVLLAALVTFFILRDGKIASDLPTMIAVLALGGFGCAEIGKRLPVIRNLGAAAIFATFRAVLPCLRAPPPGGDGEADRRVHQGLEFPLSLYRRDHRRQHLRNGPAGANQGLPEDLRPT